MTANDSYDNTTETVAQYAADPAVEQLLHFVNADPNSTPSFDVFPIPDFYLSTGTGDPTVETDEPNCPTSTPATAAANCIVDQQRVRVGSRLLRARDQQHVARPVGPGVAHKGVDGFTAAQGPSSADGSNSSPQLVT